jgi:hypothetical protein
MNRRDVLKTAAGSLAAALPLTPKTRKRIIISGAGIGGLSCAWELVKLGMIPWFWKPLGGPAAMY